MTDNNYKTYSSKAVSKLGTGVGYGVNEMAETALSMGLNHQKREWVEGVTGDIESAFLSDVLQDGMSAGLGYLTGQAMQLQEHVMSGTFKKGGALVIGWYGKSLIKDKFKSFRKGRKAGMFSKFLGSSDKKAEESRLLSDFVKMDMDATSNAHNPMAKHNALEGRLKYDSLEVQKEGVRSDLARLQIDGTRDTFEMKLKTSSFFSTDKKLIKQMTGMTSVTDKEIKKLNALSSALVSMDSEGNWIGGNEASINLLNALGLHRVN